MQKGRLHKEAEEAGDTQGLSIEDHWQDTVVPSGALIVQLSNQRSTVTRNSLHRGDGFLVK